MPYFVGKLHVMEGWKKVGKRRKRERFERLNDFIPAYKTMTVSVPGLANGARQRSDHVFNGDSEPFFEPVSAVFSY